MKKSRSSVHVLIAILTCLTGTLPAGEYNKALNLGDPMPVLENVPDTDGGMLSASDLVQSVVVLVSLANHCPRVRGMDAGQSVTGRKSVAKMSEAMHRSCEPGHGNVALAG